LIDCPEILHWAIIILSASELAVRKCARQIDRVSGFHILRSLEMMRYL
jgi:hypothetical protein